MVHLLVQARQAVLMTLLVVGAVGGVLLANEQVVGEPLALELPTMTPPTPTATLPPTPTAGPIVVFVSGAVQAPGVYTLPPGSRAVDALEAAGGPTGEAAIEALNQATLLVDGMQVHMPSQGTTAAPPPILPAAVPPAAPAASDGAGSVSAGEGQVRLNSASQEELERLPGIGPALAGRIIEYRAANGPFTSVEQLIDVRGIGDKLLEEIRDRVVLQ